MTVVRRMAVLAVISVCCFVSHSAPAAEKPNIVYILADDMGYGDLSCYGQKTLKTPNIDRLADEGMRFTQHYAGLTVCAPSRGAFLTGRHTGHCRIRSNGPAVLQDSDITIAQRLKTAGYATGCTGKWGVGNPPPLNDPNLRGFDHFYGYVGMWHAHNFYPEFMIENGRKSPLRNVVPEKWKTGDGRGVATKRVDYAPNFITQQALDFIDRNKDRPFFLYYAMNVPHANNEAGKNGMEVPDQYEFAKKDWPEPERGFAAMIRNIDNDVGKVVAKLKALGIDEKTLVIFTSDNGPHQEGGHMVDFFDSNGPLRGFKRDMYEGGIREPMIARWPGKIKAGTQSDLISAFWDMMPTFCELAGVRPPENTDGISIVPTLLGGPERQREHEFLYWQFEAQGGKQAVRLGDWKGVRLNMMKNPDGPIELYNLKDDLGETKNIAADHPDIVAQIRRIMKEQNAPPK